MTHDGALAEAIRELLADERDVIEKRMFGGQAFLVGGHLAVAASGRGGLMVRIDPAEAETLTQDPRVSRMIMQGRETDGWLRVDIEAPTDDDPNELAAWVRRGVEFAASLPPK